jgi:hypothetical protein
MASPSLLELNEFSATLGDPAFTSSFTPKPGGIDPLGLRQINFDLMDLVFPGLNNVARHIRPFTLVTWAWRRAAVCAHSLGQVKANTIDLQDFVDRMEVIYAWSQFLRPQGADLPGSDVLAPLIRDGKYEFGGKDWLQKRETRKYSTALSSPLNYGPALKTLGWLQPDAEGKGAWAATPRVYAALDAFEKQIAGYLSHPAFSQFGVVSITNAELTSLAETWALERPTEAEKRIMAETLAGASANKHRRDGINLAVAAARHLDDVTDFSAVRRTMCGLPSDFIPPPELKSAARAWRDVQIRQAFRLALEALFHWALRKLDQRSMTTAALAEAFLNGAGNSSTTEEWLSADDAIDTGPSDWVDRLEESLSPLDDEIELLQTIRSVLTMSLSEAPEKAGSERDDRLPLARAANEVNNWRNQAPATFIVHVLESWIFGQHVYWSVGRGLADARGRGKTILRLKVTLEENGWAVAPGANVADRNAPEATGDRLETALTLLREAGLSRQ